MREEGRTSGGEGGAGHGCGAGAQIDPQREEWETRFAGMLQEGRIAPRDAPGEAARDEPRDAGAPVRVGYEDWLDPWLPFLAETADSALPVLDLGCGAGADSVALTGRGFRVIACDYSPSALALVAAACPGIETALVDLRETLPFAAGSARAVVADLSLHYFSSAATLGILCEIRRVLVDGGLFLARFNSLRDILHGAGRGRAIEENYFLHEGRYKRFFDARMMESLVAPGWEVLALVEKTTRRYADEKALWEFAGRKPC
jgi:SAM-dependent methyltransferase